MLQHCCTLGVLTWRVAGTGGLKKEAELFKRGPKLKLGNVKPARVGTVMGQVTGQNERGGLGKVGSSKKSTLFTRSDLCQVSCSNCAVKMGQDGAKAAQVGAMMGQVGVKMRRRESQDEAKVGP